MRGRIGSRLPASVVAALCLLAAPASASDLAAEWRDLHGRCADAVTAAAPLDRSGLVDLPPEATLEPRTVELGDDTLTRFDPEVARISARTVPTGTYAHPGGRLRLRLIEYTTRPGSRAICEIVTPARAALTAGEGETLARAFRDWRDGLSAPWRDVDFGGGRLGAGYGINARGCDVVASFAHDGGRLRSSVGERAGDPSCGGPSLLTGASR